MSKSPSIKKKTTKTLRNSGTGRFTIPDPQDDPAVLDEFLRAVRAIDCLEPLLKATLEGEGADSTMQRMFLVTRVVLAQMKAQLLLELEAQEDRSWLKDAKNRAYRLLRNWENANSRPVVVYVPVRPEQRPDALRNAYDDEEMQYLEKRLQELKNRQGGAS